MSFLRLICLLLLACFHINAQSAFSRHYFTRHVAGESAISPDTIYSKTLHLAFPVYEFLADTVNSQLLFSTRQKGEGQDNVYLNKGGFAALDYMSDTLKYKNELALYSLNLAPGALLAGKDNKTVVFHRALGYDLQHFYSPVLYTFSREGFGLQYLNSSSDTLSCVNLLNGAVSWTAVVRRAEDWSEVRQLNDSIVLIAAGGLYAFHLRNGLLWHQPVLCSAPNVGSLTYSLARHRTVKQISNGISTRLNDSLITHLCSNIFVLNDRIYFAGRKESLCLRLDGSVVWRYDLSDYDPAKTLITKAPVGLYLVNFGLGVHAENYVIRNTPYLLTIDEETGELTDQYDLKEINNLADFMKSRRGLSFGGKEKILEMTVDSGFRKTAVPLGKVKYGAFSEFINGDDYYCLVEGRYVPLTFVNDRIIYFLADNNKIYGLEGSKLLYEYHFNELYKLVHRYGDKRILSGLTTTIITDRNFELLATLRISEKSVLLKDKLYFIEDEKIHIVDLNTIR